jgi:HD-like signal output (HDOD) protein/CheY-like chemotaxis protein
MRVLFADDAAGSFERMRIELKHERPDWQLSFVHTEAEALASLAATPFDALVAVMSSPQLDGPELLSRVRERHPNAVRLCLPGDMEDEAFLRAMPVTHQFLANPCTAEGLLEIIERACDLRAILQNTAIRELIGTLKALPGAPKTFQALSAAIARPNAHTADITGIVSRDNAVAIKTLQIVNTAFFRRSAPIISIQAAVTYVGLEMLKSIALSASVFDALDASPAGRLLTHLQALSLRRAHLARLLLGESRLAEEGFTAALMLDIGQAVLALADPGQFERMIASAREQGRPWHEVEPRFFGVAHPEVGACLLGLWGLPLELVETVAYHHHPVQAQHAQTRVLAAVHVADVLADSADPSGRLLPRLDAEFFARPEAQRCLAEWHIDDATDAHSAEHALAL